MLGKTVSHYSIFEKLGEGGMGVVYKAEDIKLKRIVALKFLPPHVSSTSEQQARFLQEAQAAAKLNHPHVCSVFDIQEADGQSFIVMEYVDGVTLRQKLQGCPLKVSDAIEYAIQIGEALQEAHENGIVHRDVKADNIMITSRGLVKVMDFGLARLRGSLKLTRSTSTLGTLPYMPPEQIQGGNVDARSDIFSFGVVVYEMLTGQMPFRGEHEAAVMYSILNEEPEPLQQYIPDAQSELIHIINRALEKESDDRYQTVNDMLIDLRRVKKESSKSPRPGVHDVGTQGKPAARLDGDRKKIRWKAVWLAIAGVTIVGAALAILILPRRSELRLNPNRTYRTLHTPYARLQYPALSRDGNWVVFPAAHEDNRWDVYVMSLAAPEPTKVSQEGCPWIVDVDLSPDATLIAYSRLQDSPRRWQVRVVPFQGGMSRTVADTGLGARWTPDGRRIGYLRDDYGSIGLWSGSGRREIWSINPDGTDNRCELIDTVSSGLGSTSFCWSPDGASIAWVRLSPQGYGEVMVRELATGEERQITSDRKNVDEVVWTTDDVIFFVSDRSGQSNVWAVTSGGGELKQVTHGSVPISAARLSADNQRLLFYQMGDNWQLWIAGIDGSNSHQLTTDDLSVYDASFSRDVNSIAAVMGEGYGLERHLYVMDAKGLNRRKLTSGSQYVERCCWSLNGEWIAYSSRHVSHPSDSSIVYLVGASGSNPPRPLHRGTRIQWISSQVLVVLNGMKTFRCSIEDGTAAQVYEDSSFTIPIEGNQRMVVWDYRKGREGFWLALYGSDADELYKRKGIGSFDEILGVGIGPGFLIYSKGRENVIWRMSLEDGQQKQIGRFPGESVYILDISADGSEALWRRSAMQSKLVLIEDPFD